MRPAFSSPGLACAALVALLSSAACQVPTLGVGAMTPVEREDYVRLSMKRARELRARGDLVMAERLVRDVVAAAPQNRRALLLHASLLEEIGESDRAAAVLLAARELAPGALPSEPLPVAEGNILVSLAGSEVSASVAESYLSALTDAFSAVVADRLRTRLPSARLTRLVPTSVKEGSRWLDEWKPRLAISLHPKRGYCRESMRDGFFALVELDVVLARAGEPEPIRLSILDRYYDLHPDTCLQEAAARALETMFARKEVRAALGSPGAAGSESEPAVVSPSSSTVRAIFKGLEVAIGEQLERGRLAMSDGRPHAALAAFRKAFGMDPEDPLTLAHLKETEATLALQRELRTRGESFVSDALAATLRGNDNGELP